MMSFRRKLVNRVENQARFARIMAKMIDFSIVFFLIVLFGPPGILLGATYLVLSDSLFEGQSIGKKIFGFKVIDLETAKPCSLNQSFIRNSFFIFPTLLCLGGFIGVILGFLTFTVSTIFEAHFIKYSSSFKRLGDTLANTTVLANDPELNINSLKDQITQTWQTELSAPVQKMALI